MRSLTVKNLIVLLVLLACIFTFTPVSIAHQQSGGFNQSLDNLARDIAQSSGNFISKGANVDIEKLSDEVFSRLEAVSLNEIQSFIDAINTPQQLDYAVESASSFAAANHKLPYILASLKTIKLINEKTRFLIAQSGQPEELLAISKKASEAIRCLSSQKNTLAKNQIEKISENITVKSGVINTKAPARSPSKLKFGANFYPETNTTTFALNAPRATAVKLAIFESAAAKTGREYDMKKTADGVWYLSFNQNLTSKFYGYYVDGPAGKGERFDAKNLLSDPYAHANDGSYGKSIVTDTRFNWSANFNTPQLKDMVIYEMHVKSYTAHSSSGVAADKRGKYLGLLEGVSSERVLGNLKELGVNAVELLPVHEFDNKAAPSGVNYWGYMTTHFMAPESSYASKAGGQVNELKKLIDGLHKNGIAVILDVVYNHTAEGNEQGPIFNFKGIDNHQYYRLCNNPEFYWNGTGCGNEFRTESPLGRRYVLDTLIYWATEYKIDGFRFDLATIIDKDTMMAINNTLAKNVVLIAEPWAADWNRNLWSKGDFRNTRWAKWNDDFKNNVRNFASGRANRDNMMTLICGTCYWWAGKPTESVNFVECHDNATMMDACGGNAKIAMLAGLITLTSQGVPMLHEGQEFLKTKFGNDNSYDQDNEINHIDWKLKTKNRKAFDFFAGLVKLRMAYPHFRNDRPLSDREIKWMLVENHNGLGYQLIGKDSDVIVLLNGDQNNWIKFNLPDDKEWKVLCNGAEVNLSGLTGAKGDYSVPPVTGVILARKK